MYKFSFIIIGFFLAGCFETEINYESLPGKRYSSFTSTYVVDLSTTPGTTFYVGETNVKTLTTASNDPIDFPFEFCIKEMSATRSGVMGAGPDNLELELNGSIVGGSYFDFYNSTSFFSNIDERISTSDQLFIKFSCTSCGTAATVEVELIYDFCD